MAIIGYLDEVISNYKFGANIKRGLDYLSQLRAKEFAGLKPGDVRRVQLLGTKVFAINQLYNSKPFDMAKFEAHEKYIDLQYIFDGEEAILIGSQHDGRISVAYDKEKDLKFYSLSHFSRLNLKKGMVAIFFPQDIHAPALDISGTGLVKKTVVKVATK